MFRINLKISPTSFVFILLLLFQGSNLLSLLMLLTALTLHEISHLYTSESLGYHGSELKFTLLGGCIQLDPLFEIDPESEFLIAASGPLTNWLMVGGVIYLKWLGFGNYYLDIWQKYNFLIGFVNLIPALPLDGGRILHAGLNKWLGLEKSVIWSKRVTFFWGFLLLGYGMTKLCQRQGGFLYLVISIFLLANIIYIKKPQLNLIWRLLQRKKQKLGEKGYLKIKPVLVTPESRIWDILRKFGSNDYLLFYIYRQQQEFDMIQEESAWDTIVSRGFNASFMETMKSSSKSNYQPRNQ